MSGAKPFLGETTDRGRAFAGIASLDITVVQDKWGHHTREAWQRERHYTLDDIPRELACVNRRCQQGGLDLQKLALFWSGGEHTFFCNGHEGTPQGRRKGDPCDNVFVVILKKTTAAPM